MENLGNNSVEALRLFIERVERLEDEKSNIASDIRDVFAEAKAMGYDNKAMRQIIRLRKKSKSEREEEENILHAYEVALGMTGKE